MRAALLLAAMLVAAPAPAQDQAAADAAARMRVTDAIDGSGFIGTYAVYAGPRRIAGGSVGAAVEGADGGGFDYQVAWPWTAALTAQALEVLAWQEVDAGRLSPGAPASRFGAGSGTVRALLARGAGTPEDRRRFVALLERQTRMPILELFGQRIAGPLGLTAGFIAPEASAPDASWPGGPTGEERRALADQMSLAGTPVDLVTFDRGLLDGTLLSTATRDAMWRGQARPLALPGCAAPVQAVERRGAAGRFAVRSVLLPQLGVSAVFLTNRGAGGFGPGEQPVLRALAAVACA